MDAIAVAGLASQCLMHTRDHTPRQKALPSALPNQANAMHTPAHSFMASPPSSGDHERRPPLAMLVLTHSVAELSVALTAAMRLRHAPWPARAPRTHAATPLVPGHAHGRA